MHEFDLSVLPWIELPAANELHLSSEIVSFINAESDRGFGLVGIGLGSDAIPPRNRKLNPHVVGLRRVRATVKSDKGIFSPQNRITPLAQFPFEPHLLVGMIPVVNLPGLQPWPRPKFDHFVEREVSSSQIASNVNRRDSLRICNRIEI